MAAKKPWDDEWFKGERLTGGQQGLTFFARRRSDPEDQFQYVLKILKSQRDHDRRGRMHVEVAILETLEHAGVAKLVESNATDFKTEDIDLYLVTERVVGPDLVKWRESDGCGFETTCTIMLHVLKILDFCHQKGATHRDLKPAHVILRDGSPSDPVLIDFGLAFREEAQPTDFETAGGQHIGNRFIIGPEQSGLPDDKRDVRADVFQCVGLLFYLLTGQVPGYALDGNGKKPHQRHDLRAFIPEIEQWKLDQLVRIFDVGFEWQMDRRWSSSEAMREQIEKLTRSEEPVSLSLVDQLVELKKRASESPEIERLRQINSILDATTRFYSKAHQTVGRDGRGLVNFNGRGTTQEPTQRGYSFRLTHFDLPSRFADCLLKAEVTETEVILRGQFKAGAEVELTRFSLFDPTGENLAELAIAEFVGSCVEKVVLPGPGGLEGN